MVKKKVDARVRTLLENCVKTNHRSFIVLVGDHGKDQVVNLHYILSKTVVKARPKVLWCYKKELGFSTHKQKRMKQIKKQMSRGLYDSNTEDPFELFISSTDIRWCYYKETQKILGQTYGMCVLQDFEAITPNILARTIETVEGGGVVVLLLRTMTSLKKLYTMSMDVHARFRTEAHQDVVARFNERFILSLSNCDKCLVLDDELNVLPISKHARNIEALPPVEDELTPDQRELADLKESLKDTQPVGSLVAEAKTLDQAKAILTFAEAISEKTLRSTVTLTAGRGRGKSAALGMSLAAAVAYGYSNIFVTAPSPENLGTVFDFVFKGFDALKYKEHLDYEIIQSTNPEFNRAVVRVNIFREHRQTIQYIQPNHHEKLAQAELLAIDEAAAIPLPVVKNLLGPYLVFMSSTINGYEGTGRSLSLKLIQKLREQQGSAGMAAQQAMSAIHGDNKTRKGERKLHEERWQAASAAAHQHMSAPQASAGGGRVLREVTLDIPIRYAQSDAVEKWLNALLCLDCGSTPNRIMGGTPHPRECELYYVDRDSLFSYHKLSENFLQRIMSLYVASHYKNQPNDLQLLSDAPAHHIFVLLGPQAEGQGNAGQLPDVLCVVQVALEGEISKESVAAQLSRGQRASGDLIPWTVAQQFQDNEFAGLSGARVVRIATHPDVTGMGYGSRAVELLTKYYQGELANGDVDSDADDAEKAAEKDADSDDEGNLLKEKVKPRKALPPLLVPLTDRPAERLHWFGTSFGLTLPLYTFWQRAGFRSVYIRQTANTLTGEHTAIMLNALKCDDLPASPSAGWLDEFVGDARKRFMALLAYEFRTLPPTLALSLLSDAKAKGSETDGDKTELLRVSSGLISANDLQVSLTPFDVKRLQSYAKNMVDYHMIVDLIPAVARLYFLNRLPDTTLSYLQRAILMSIGLQHQSVDSLVAELNVPSNQLLALFNKSVRKFATAFNGILEAEVEATIAAPTEVAAMAPTELTLEEDLKDAKDQALQKLKQKELLDTLNLSQYAVRGDDADWAAALEDKKDVTKGVQVKGAKKKKRAETDEAADADKKKKMKKGAPGKKSKYANLK
ncbi:N-acetyltransferase 10 [Achlya hypogyna]|uniref:RNA cytidine acetyltransferase n=1 Tax=Achlya hypogyna TaxID=1202772 RepID=A0A1V9YCU8_ACHHY|nr:N-acetyltransferase 10 [Achlya hypogyna]